MAKLIWSKLNFYEAESKKNSEETSPTGFICIWASYGPNIRNL